VAVIAQPRVVRAGPWHPPLPRGIYPPHALRAELEQRRSAGLVWSDQAFDLLADQAAAAAPGCAYDGSGAWRIAFAATRQAWRAGYLREGRSPRRLSLDLIDV